MGAAEFEEDLLKLLFSYALDEANQLSFGRSNNTFANFTLGDLHFDCFGMLMPFSE